MKKNKSVTKKYRTQSRIFTILSWLLCFGICAYLIISALSGRQPNEDGLTLKQRYGTLLYSLGTTVLIVAGLSIVVKDKIEPTVWMVNIILAGYLYNMTAVYIIFGIWFVDTYVIKPLKRLAKSKYLINKEIDKRIE